MTEPENTTAWQKFLADRNKKIVEGIAERQRRLDWMPEHLKRLKRKQRKKVSR